MTERKWLREDNVGKAKKIYTTTSSSKKAKSDEIVDLVQTIEDKKQELNDAEFIVQFHPKIINNLEKKLFQKIKGV